MTHRPTTSRRRPRRSAAARGWLPNQHGAWAMLIVPFIVGVVLRSRAGEPGGAWLIPLAAAEFAAYFAFNALGLWLHAAPARRAGFRPLSPERDIRRGRESFSVKTVAIGSEMWYIRTVE